MGIGILLFTLPVKKNNESIGFITETLYQYGFSVWAIKDITQNESVIVKEYLSPNLWDGTFYGNDVDIRTVIIAYDLDPQPPSFTQKHLYPGIDNSRLLLFSYHFQKAVSQDVLRADSAYKLCSTANDLISRACLSQLCPTSLLSLDHVLKKSLSDVKSKYTVIKDLTRSGCYSRVYLIEYHGSLAVEKIYRQEYIEKFEREKKAYLDVAGKVDGIPKALAIGKRSFILPFIEEKFHFESSGWRLVPIKSIFSIINTLRQIYEAGYAVIDCHSGNCLFGRDGKVWLIDFEFLYKYTSQPECFIKSYDIVGIPEDFDGETPPGEPDYLQHPWLNDFGITPQFVLNHNKLCVNLYRSFFWSTTVFPRYGYRKLRSGYRFLLAFLNLLVGRFMPSLKHIICIRMRP